MFQTLPITNQLAAIDSRSCRQPPVEFIQDHRQALSEQIVNPSQAADGVERGVIEIVFLDPQAFGNVILDGVEPLALLIGEDHALQSLLGKP